MLPVFLHYFLFFQVFIASSRISVYTEPLDTWVLKVQSVEAMDQGIYDCHLNYDKPVKMSLHLTVRGERKGGIILDYEAMGEREIRLSANIVHY